MIADILFQAQHLAQRSASNDPEFVYAVCKLLHRIGTATPDGNAAVIRVRDAWKDLAVKLAGLRAAGIGRRPVVTSASSANSSKVSAIQLPPILS